MKPIYKVTLKDSESEDITSRFMGLVMSLSITSRFGKSSDSMSISVVNPGFAVKFPEFRKRIELAIGYGQNPITFGDFHVSSVNITGKPDTMTITGTSTRFGGRLFMARSESFNTQKTVTEIIETIARDTGMRPKVDFSATNVPPLIRHLKNESYMNFLTRLAEKHNCNFKPTGDIIYFLDNRKRKTFSGAINNPINIKLTECESFSVSYSHREKIKNVSAVWHDMDSGEYAEVVEIGDEENREDVFRIAGNFLSETDAREAIRRFLQEKSDQHQELSLSMVGNPDIRAASRIATIDGFYPELAREWFVVSATHTLNGGGYKTTVRAVPLGDQKNE